MKVKILFILIFSFLFLGFQVANAGVIINEVKYSPTTKQWIEIYNDTNENIDITTYKILDSGATKNGHSITPFDDGSNIIPKYGFGIISKSPSDFGAASFPLFKSALNIKVSGDTIVFKNDSGEVDSIDIDGSATSGNSFQKISGSWVSAVPTPGLTNEDTFVDDSDTNEESDQITTIIQKPKSKMTEVPTIKAKILANNLAFSGQPFEIQTDVLGLLNEKIVLGRAYWNFGDGGSLEQVNNFEKFEHTYYYPGEYVLMLEYFQKSSSKIPDATSKMIIKVLPTTVTISKVGDTNDFFIELTNNATSDIDVSGWIIRANNKIFVLPKNTIIISKKQVTLSSKITGFVDSDQYILKLFSATGELVFDYNDKHVSSEVIYKNRQVLNKGTVDNTTEKSVSIQPSFDLESEADNTSIDLVAAPILGEVDGKKNSDFFFVGFIVLLIISGGIVYYIRQGKNVSKVGDDFKIIDE